jgi:predicted RNA-binding protein YlqC (UPF0109 family)
MREFLEYIVKRLVDQPDGIMLEEETKDDKVVFKLKVAQGDMGKIIGRKGRTAQALRVLLTAVAAKEKKRAILELVEPPDSAFSPT